MSEPQEFDADRETFEQAEPTPQHELDQMPDIEYFRAQGVDPETYGEPDVPEQGA